MGTIMEVQEERQRLGEVPSTLRPKDWPPGVRATMSIRFTNEPFAAPKYSHEVKIRTTHSMSQMSQKIDEQTFDNYDDV